jgi:hypothetical protein
VVSQVLCTLLDVAYLHRSETTSVARVLRRHAHTRAEDRWGRSRAVRSASRSRVVLGTSPAKADTRVANGVALHLVDGHLRGVTLDELDETAALARGNLDIGDLAEALEEGTELVLGDVSTESTDENSSVVRVSELIHGLGSAVVAHWGSTHGIHAHARSAATLLHLHAARATRSTALVLGGSSADAHRTVAAVNALHLGKSLLLVLLIGETDETVTARHAADGVGHDLGGLGRGVLVLEELDEDELGNFRAKVSNKDGELRATLVTAAVGKATSRGPVELEGTVGVGDELSVEGEGLRGSVRAGEVNEAISSVTAAQISLRDITPLIFFCLPREFVADHLDVDGLAHVVPDAADEVLVDPRLKLTHPDSC